MALAGRHRGPRRAARARSSTCARTGNLSTGGTAIDLTDQVHPDNAEMAVRAAKAIGLDVVGIDFITPDITESYRDVGGGICEVNAAPGFRMHVAPTEGKPRDVAGPVMDMLFPKGSLSRIPIAAITGTNGKTTACRMLAHIHKMDGATVGLATTDGVYIDGRAHGRRRHDRPAVGPDGPARPVGRHGGPRDGARRAPAGGDGLPARATSARCSTSPPTTSGRRASTRSSSWPR